MNYLIDVESTGMSSKDEVIQLAWIRLPDNLQLIKEYEIDTLLSLPTSVQFFNPSVPINIEAQKIHGLNKLKLIKYPKSITCKLPDDCTLATGHNIIFDLRMLKVPTLPNVCTKKLAISKNLVKQNIVKDNKLITLFEYYYPVEQFPSLHKQFSTNFHDALNDCFKTLLILKELL